jgi:hypothetical protein
MPKGNTPKLPITSHIKNLKIRFMQMKDGSVCYIFLFDVPKNNVLITKVPFSKSTKVKMFRQ